MKMMKIHLLTNPKFLGDKNQALGIKKKLDKKYENTIIAEEYDDSNATVLTDLREEIESDKSVQHILIAIGDHGLWALKQMGKFSNGRVLSVYASRQFYPDLLEVAELINMIALPVHAISSSIRDALEPFDLQLVETIGVAHNVDEAELEKAYADWQESENPIQVSENYIGIVLGGDAPESDKTMRYFTTDEAKTLGRYLVEFYQQNNNVMLLITNSPRTGKYDPVTGEECKVHTTKWPDLDKTSAALLEELDFFQIKYQFFNFTTGNPSAYKPILYVLKSNKNNIAIVTGDSTSMITEMSDILSVPLYIFHVGSMNDTHKAHVISASQTYAIDKKNKTDIQLSVIQRFSKQTAAESIVIAIDDFLKKMAHQNKLKMLECYTVFSTKAGLLFSHRERVMVKEEKEGSQRLCLK